MHKHLTAEHCTRKHKLILTVDNIAAYDKKTSTPSRSLACFRVEIWAKKNHSSAKYSLCRIQPCEYAGRHLYLWGKTNLGKPTVSWLWCRAQKCCQLGESPWCHIPSSRKSSFSHLQWNNVVWQSHSPNTPGHLCRATLHPYSSTEMYAGLGPPPADSSQNQTWISGWADCVWTLWTLII